MAVIQNKTLLSLTDQWLVDGVPKGFPGATVSMEVTDPDSNKLPDVGAIWADVDNKSATGTFLVTEATLTTTVNDNGKPTYTPSKPPWKFQFRVDLPDASHQYMNEFGVHVAPNLDDS